MARSEKDNGLNLPWKAGRRVEPDEARRLIQAQFPDLGKESVLWLGEGWDNTVYLVDGRWVFRFPRRQLTAELLDHESRALNHMLALTLSAVDNGDEVLREETLRTAVKSLWRIVE